MPSRLVDDVQDRLATDRFGRSLRWFEEVESTNAEAAAWAREGGAEGAVVLTNYQTGGRGRQGRTWTADKGQNLLFSVVLRPTLPPDRLSLITIAAAVGVAESIEAFVKPHKATIEWPNDVLLEGRKTCGILLESSVSTPRAASVVVLGVGLNVNQTDFPGAISDTATSLRLTTGRRVPRAPLLTHLLSRLENRYDQLQDDGAESVRAAFHDRMASVGEMRTLRRTASEQSISGTVRGITETGALRLETGDGLKTLHAGDVTTHS